jgi:hypothetical protein
MNAKENPFSPEEQKLLRQIREGDYQLWDQAHALAQRPDDVEHRKKLGIALYEAVLLHSLSNLLFEPEEVAELHRLARQFHLTAAEISAIKNQYAQKAVKTLIEHCLIDGVLTEAEEHRVRSLGRELELSEEHLQEMLNTAIKKRQINKEP